MNNVMKGIIILAVIIYIVSPIDIAPGPIDDILVLLMGIAASKSLNFLQIKPRKAACYADVKSCLHQRKDRFVAIPAEMWYSNTQKDRKKDRIVWAKD